jgi:CheY-like chemotaxis protein
VQAAPQHSEGSLLEEVAQWAAWVDDVGRERVPVNVSETSFGPSRSIVLVDDSQEVREILHRLLASAGFEVVGEGADGDEAIILAHRLQPALLLLDTSMPRVDGIEALPVILAVSPDTKVVMFTGFEEPELATRALEFGAADFVEKSIRLEELPLRLQRVMNVADGERPAPGRPQLRAVEGVDDRDHPPDAWEAEQTFLPGVVRPCGDRHGHSHVQRDDRPGQPGAGGDDDVHAA